MKYWITALASLLILTTSCKDKNAPTISSFKINAVDIDLGLGTYSAAVSETANFQVIVNDDEELLQFIAFIDTTDLGDVQRLYSDGLSGTEQLVTFSFTMAYIKSLSTQYYFGNPVPIHFRVIDNNQNFTTEIITFTVL